MEALTQFYGKIYTNFFFNFLSWDPIIALNKRSSVLVRNRTNADNLTNNCSSPREQVPDI